MDDTERNRLDALLDLLTDEVARRIETRPRPVPEEFQPPQSVLPVPTSLVVLEATQETATEAALELTPESATETETELETKTELDPTPEMAEIVTAPAPSASSHAASLMVRLALGVLAIIVLINVPLDAQGMALARSIPNSASLIIRDGLLVKEATSPDVYVYRDGTFRWITSLEAFQQYGYRWEDVHTVESGYLSKFDQGSPLYLLLKCDGSPHVYGFEGGLKRWIVDIPTFQSEGYAWKDVRSVPCDYLRGLPDGESIPPGRGSPPPPVP